MLAASVTVDPADEHCEVTNTMSTPDRVTLRAGEDGSLSGGVLTLVMPPVSWTAVKLTGVARA